MVAAAVVLVLSGCGGGGDVAASGSPAGSTTARATSRAGNPVTMTVMAPVPLKTALDKAKTAFESSHPGTTVALNYGHVPALLTQIEQGVPADVLVTTDETTMKQARSKGAVVASTVPVAKNRLALVVPMANPGHVKDVGSLGDATLAIAVCAAELPCGKLTDDLASNAGITLAADSREPGGSPAIVTKAATGEIDLGVAFATDIAAANGKVASIPLDEKLGVTTTVVAAMVTSPGSTASAEQFLAFLSSADGKAIFADAGFRAP
jgi:molybdate transport system substrate-binding protein